MSLYKSTGISEAVFERKANGETNRSIPNENGLAPFEIRSKAA